MRMVNGRQHYFFRMGNSNHIFKKNYELLDAADLNKGLKLAGSNRPADRVQLGIYYSSFTVEDYRRWQKLNFKDLQRKEGKSLSGNNLAQARIFFDAPKGSIFWIFLDEYIVGVESLCNGESARNCDELRLQYDGAKVKSIAKIREFKVKRLVSRLEAPELFVTLDSAGIRGTIELSSSRHSRRENCEIGNALLEDNAKIVLPDVETALRYLAPVQLETVIFKLFNDLGFIASAFRGGSKYQVDLLVQPHPEGKRIVGFDRDGAILIQAKRTLPEADMSLKVLEHKYFNKGIYLVTSESRPIRGMSGDQRHPLYIGPSELATILRPPAALSCVRWIKSVLGDRCFEHKYI